MMEWWVVTLFAIILLFALVASGLSIATTLGLIGLVGLSLTIGFDQTLNLLALSFYRTAGNFVLIAIPLYILMARLLMISGASDDIFSAFRKWVGGLQGSLAIVSILSSAVFAAMCGVSIASIATIGLIAIPQMLKQGYDRRLAVGSVCAGGTLAVLIPPSIQFILIGWLTEQSIGKLFIAGILPGIILTALYASYVLVRVVRNPHLAPPSPSVGLKEKIASLKFAWAPVLLILLVLGTIYTGIATATESAGVGAFAALFMIFLYKNFSLRKLGTAMADTVRTTGSIMIICLAAFFFGQFLTVAGASANLVRLVSSLTVSPWLIFIAINIVLLLLGCIMDTGSIILIVSPIIFPIIEALGFDPLWFSVIMVINMEIGLMTPPVGANLFMLRIVVPEVSWSDIIMGSLPFVGMALIALVIMALFPQLSLWLPRMMMGV